MNFDVPQYIDVEDKIAFQLTAKQLGWFGLGGVLMFLAWNFASQQMFIMWSIMIVLLSLAFAFIRPYGISLASFIGYGFLHIIRPKEYIWRRQADVSANDIDIKQGTKAMPDRKAEKARKMQQIDNLANVLDSKRNLR